MMIYAGTRVYFYSDAFIGLPVFQKEIYFVCHDLAGGVFRICENEKTFTLQ